MRHTALAAGVTALCALPGLSPAQQAAPAQQAGEAQQAVPAKQAVPVQPAQPAAPTGDVLKSVRMVRTDAPPVIDGRLDDAVWAQAAVVDDFHQSQPIEGAEPTERTEIYLLYDEDALYIGGRFWDSRPDLIAAGTLRHRSLRLGDDDRIAIVLSPYNDRRSGYKFETNANGVKHEAIYQNVSQNLPVWNTIWDVASTTDSEGWVTEIAIPLKSISFDPENDTWGINFSRAVRRKGEEISWVSRNRSYNPGIVGLATGLTGLQQGLGLDVVPSLALNRRRLFDPASSPSGDTYGEPAGISAGNPSADSSRSRPSLDLFYKITPSLNSALTLNTDFSATEVDSRQVNLTRFNLFFPEQRAFFLQDTDIFEFGRIGGRNTDTNQSVSGPSRENGRPFFSRRLGLSDSGQPVDLDYGGKLSGRIGPWSVGGLAVRQAEFGGVESSDVFVGRASLSILEESAVGFIVTDGDPNTNLDNSVAGVDFRYLNSRLGNSRVLEADAWFLQSDTEGLSEDDRAFGLGLSAPNRAGLRWGLAAKEVQRNFNPALGYVNRSGIRDRTADLGYTHHFRGGPIASWFASIDAQRIERLDGGLQTQVFTITPLEIDSRSRDTLVMQYKSTDEVLIRPFRIYRDPSDTSRQVVIPGGRYSFDEYIATASSGSHRNFVAAVNYRWGDFFSGQREQYSTIMTLRPTKHFTFRIAYDYHDIRLPQGAFVTRLAHFTSEVAFNSDVLWTNRIQYDNVSEEVGINSRLHWVLRDGREAYLVLNHNLQDYDRDNSYDETLADLSLKVNYTFRF